MVAGGGACTGSGAGRSSAGTCADDHAHQSSGILMDVKMLEDEDLPQFVDVDVVHSQQLYDWDCGLSCIKMTLSEEKRQVFSDQLETILRDEDLDTSIWSIDLTFILNRIGVPHVYYTETIGIDPSYSNQSYYQDVVDVDRSRVLRKFQDAQENGIRITNRALRLTEILEHLAKQKTAIVLIDGTFLECESHFSHKAESKLSKVLRSCPYSSFTGHYVVVCGYDMTKGQILYRNPAYRKGVCRATFSSFERARHSHGTDDDVILVT